MTVFHVRFDHDSDTISRSTRFADTTKEMKSSVKEFINTNVTFIGEFPSCLVVNEESKSTSSTERYTEHTEINNTVEYAQLSCEEIASDNIKSASDCCFGVLSAYAE